MSDACELSTSICHPRQQPTVPKAAPEAIRTPRSKRTVDSPTRACFGLYLAVPSSGWNTNQNACAEDLQQTTGYSISPLLGKRLLCRETDRLRRAFVLRPCRG